MSVIADHILFYTSTDDGGGPGGWQVKWESGDGTAIPGLRDQLLAGVRTDLEQVGELAKFPTRAERASFPRRLEHRALAEGRAGIWHAIPAGTDGSGRPGNVAVTAVALSAEHMAGAHAIDLWRSESFPTPFGPIEVAATQAPESLQLHPGELASPAAICDFLLPDYPQPVRVGLLARILDAADAAVRNEGPKLALIVADCGEAARWIAAVCAFAPPGWSAALNWSTWERAHHLLDPALADLHLVAIPREDRSALARVASAGIDQARLDRSRLDRARILIDPEADLLDPDLDEPVADGAGRLAWRFASGDHVPVGDWSGIATSCAAEGPRTLADTLAMLRHVDPGPATPEPARELAWARAAKPGDGATAELYVAAVVQRPNWLLGPQPPRPLATADAIRVGDAEESVELVARQLDQADGDTAVEVSVTGLRMLDFLASCRIVVADARLLAALVRSLAGPRGLEIIRRASPLQSATLPDDLRRTGSRQERRTVSWLLDNPGAEAGPPWMGTEEPATAAIAVPRQGEPVPPSWKEQAWALAERTPAWYRLPGAGPSQACQLARSCLATVSITPDSVFLGSRVIARDDPDIMAALAVLALHSAGGNPPADRSAAEAENLLIGYACLRDHAAAGRLLEFYLPDSLREAAVVERFWGLEYAQLLLAHPLAVLAGTQSTSQISATGTATALEDLLREVPATYDWLRSTEVISKLLGVELRPAAGGPRPNRAASAAQGNAAQEYGRTQG
jgi:hypothetical protein